MLLGAGGLAGIYLVLGTCYFFPGSGFFLGGLPLAFCGG